MLQVTSLLTGGVGPGLRFWRLYPFLLYTSQSRSRTEKTMERPGSGLRVRPAGLQNTGLKVILFPR